MFETNGRIDHVDKNDWHKFYARAEDLYGAMHLDLAHEFYNGAANNALLCAIAACDSLLVKEHGVKSAHGDHRFIVKMMEWAFKDRSKDILGDLGGLMEKKSVIQYDAVLVDKKAAEEAVKKADRVFRFVSDMIS